VTYAGNPRLWVIAGQRLYLFGRENTAMLSRSILRVS